LLIASASENNGWHAKGIGALFACILTAVLGLLSVVWYSVGFVSPSSYVPPNLTAVRRGHVSEEEHFEEVKMAQDAKAQAKAARAGQSFFSRLSTR
jgi:iron transport multicopper oxidase